jgi:hypothetical protein
LGRQTDGLRRVVSNDAIFDRDFGFHLVRSFPGKKGTEVGGGGQGASQEIGKESGRGRRKRLDSGKKEKRSRVLPAATALLTHSNCGLNYDKSVILVNYNFVMS